MATKVEQSTNVMLIGRTGVGKSCLINYLMGKEVCATGFGKSVTQGFEKFLYEDKNGFKINIYDSKGLEVSGFNRMKDNIIRFAKEKCESENFNDWLHTVFYCINSQRTRLEDDEVEFIKSLRNTIAHTI